MSFMEFGVQNSTSEKEPGSAQAQEVRPARELKKPPVLFRQTQEIIGRIEKLLDGSLLTYWNSPNGSICQLGFRSTTRVVGVKWKA
jgi:hypothetical protein